MTHDAFPCMSRRFCSCFNVTFILDAVCLRSMHVIFHVFWSQHATYIFPLHCNMFCECEIQELCSVCGSIWESSMGKLEFWSELIGGRALCVPQGNLRDVSWRGGKQKCYLFCWVGWQDCASSLGRPSYSWKIIKLSWLLPLRSARRLRRWVTEISDEILRSSTWRCVP